jgi:hypothetical protein
MRSFNSFFDDDDDSDDNDDVDDNPLLGLRILCKGLLVDDGDGNNHIEWDIALKSKDEKIESKLCNDEIDLAMMQVVSRDFVIKPVES